jgi:hypothetical protein
MKKLSLYMGILLIIITTTIDVMFPFVVPYSKGNLALICSMSILGYFGAYLYISSYLDRHAHHHYTKGWDDGINTFKQDNDDYDRVF